MNFKLKALAAALALAAAAPVFAAQIVDGTSGHSDLVMSAWDPVAQTGYAMNLNIQMNGFAGNSNLSFAPDANMAAFLGKVSPANILWNIVAVDSTGSPTVGGELNVFSTADTTPAAPQNIKMGSAVSQENTYFAYVNGLTTGDGGSPALSSGNSVYHTATSAIDYAYAGSGTHNSTFGGAFAFSNAGALGQSLNFYEISSVTGTKLTKTKVTPFAGGTWTLSSNGALNYAVTTSPVPVPAAAWLFVSGLLGLVGVSRRKSTHV